MHGRLLLAVTPLLASCTTTDDDRSLVDRPVYRAGGSPGWTVEIGDDIGLRLGHNFVDYPVVSVTYLYPHRSARNIQGGRRWRSRLGRSVITIEAMRGPCTDGDGSIYADQVRILQHGRVLTGCGGRLARRERD